MDIPIGVQRAVEQAGFESTRIREELEVVNANLAPLAEILSDSLREQSVANLISSAQFWASVGDVKKAKTLMDSIKDLYDEDEM